MRRIAVINQKGGVGKTTTTVNLGAALARCGVPTLVCDLDPQCNLTVHLDLDPATVEPSLYELFHGKASLDQVTRAVEGEPGLFVAPASVDLAGLELELVNTVGREVVLREAFDGGQWQERTGVGIILVDCPPSLGLLSLNALVACDELIVPVQAEFFALQGLGKLIEVVGLVQKRLNPSLRISAMVSCRHDPSTNLGKAVIADIKKHFGDVFLNTVIRRNVKLAEAPSHGKTIFSYDPEGRAVEDYLALAKELLAQNDGAPAAGASAPPAAPTPAPAAASTPEAASAPMSPKQIRADRS